MTEKNYVDPSIGLVKNTTEDADGEVLAEEWSDVHLIAWCGPGDMPDWARRAGIEPTGEAEDEP